MVLRAKFLCNTVADHRPAKYPNAKGWTTVDLQAVYSNSKEDNQFSEATPSAHLTMTVTTENGKSFFQPGESYYLDFTKIDA